MMLFWSTYAIFLHNNGPFCIKIRISEKETYIYSPTQNNHIRPNQEQ